MMPDALRISRFESACAAVACRIENAGKTRRELVRRLWRCVAPHNVDRGDWRSMWESLPLDVGPHQRPRVPRSRLATDSLQVVQTRPAGPMLALVNRIP